MRILFIGCVEFSLKSLTLLLDKGAEVVGVCTKSSSSFNSDFSDLRPVCIANNVPYICVEDINSQESIDWIKNMKPDVVFCFGWSSLIKKEILKIPEIGVVGYHPAKLPQNRGRHPLIWALVLGLRNSASTFFFMEEGADDGDILSQVDFSISYEDDAKSIYDKIVSIALKQITIFLPELVNNSFERKPQVHGDSNIWRKRGRKDGKIDFRMTSRVIYNLVRGLTKPYVGAHIEYKGQNVSVWKVKEIDYEKNNIEPGKILESQGDLLVVKTSDGTIQILDHDFKNLPITGEYL